MMPRLMNQFKAYGDNGYNAAYNDTPETPYYSDEFQAAKYEGREISQRAFEALSAATTMAHIPEFQSLKKEAEELAVFQTPQTKIIGLVGASGQGKSSLINSLLNCVEISPTNAGGSACTSIVTEFRQPKQNQNAPILIEIERFSNDGIAEIVEQAVIDYRRFAYINKKQSEATESNGDTKTTESNRDTKATEATKVTEVTEDEDDEEFATLKKDAELGWSILEAAFGDREDFSEEFIKGESIFATKQITQTLLKWVEESVWPATQGITRIETANNAEECSDKTSNIMEGRLWPFIRIIRVYLKAPILDAGIVFADLPGLQDTNLARVKATERYLFQCDHFFVISNISRILTDQNLKTSLIQVLSKHMLLDSISGKQHPKFTIVCTKADDLNIRGLKRDIKQKGTDEDRAKLSALESDQRNSNQKAYKEMFAQNLRDFV